MENIMEFLRELTAFQWAAIVAAIFLLWPTIQPFFSTLLNVNQVEDKQDLEDGKDTDVDLVDNGRGNLVGVVAQWQGLYEACEEMHMEDACRELTKIFPMLVRPFEKTEPQLNVSKR